jgi:hypothetical protein
MSETWRTWRRVWIEMEMWMWWVLDYGLHMRVDLTEVGCVGGESENESENESE